jgi:leader peptidase (prepilin peptidase)/N-methyltransferase
MLVELGTALLFVFCWLRTGTTITTFLNVLYSSIFVLILVTDLEHRLIQHVITLPAIAMALLGAFINPRFDTPKRALWGGGIGLVSTMALYLFGGLFARLMGRIRGQAISEVAFGFGDVTLTTFMGLIVGAPDIIFAIVIGILSGGVVATLYLLVRGLIQRRYKLFTAIPYGPFLILGGATMLYFGKEFMTWYLSR